MIALTALLYHAAQLYKYTSTKHDVLTVDSVQLYEVTLLVELRYKVRG